ncbi:MAG: class II glutamine amidotransferase [Candidatus Peribacteraceae bacterium]|nr:class II glutamine amidotransferase [Candidatus Peribacteraceae bacterium]
MPEQLEHKCAVVAGSALQEGTDDIASRIGKAMHALRNRGGAGWGIGMYTRRKALQVIGGVFEEDLGDPNTFMHWGATDGIGHDRYGTSGQRGHSTDMIQPFEFTAGGRRYAFAFNGTIANFEELKKEMGPLRVDVDTEVLRMLLIRAIEKHTRENLAAVFRELEEKLDGAFNIVMIDDQGNTCAYRDALGFHPLVYMHNDRYMAVASEDYGIKEAFPEANEEDIHPLQPGQLIQKRRGQVVIEQIMESARRAHCFFEWQYFANYLSKLEGVSVEQIRKRWGELLAEGDSDMPLDPAQVRIEPVPHSAMSAGKGYAKQRGIPHSESIERRIERRSFLQDEAEQYKVAKAKLHVEEGAELEGKDVILIDDSMVRGNSMRALVEKIRAHNPRSIHLRLTCPPVIALCFYGIDISKLSYLAARKHLNERGELTQEGHAHLAKELGVESIRFLGMEKMLQAFEEFGIRKEDLCTACITAEYPTPKGQELYGIAVKREKKKP